MSDKNSLEEQNFTNLIEFYNAELFLVRARNREFSPLFDLLEGDKMALSPPFVILMDNIRITNVFFNDFDPNNNIHT
jgi:hypothetical protein